MHRSDPLQAPNESFAGQGGYLEADRPGLTREDYLGRLVELLKPVGSETTLEVAAGTCAVSRALAPHVGLGVCLDDTPELLCVGQAEAEKAGLHDLVFVRGPIEELPFLDGSFDLVLCCLAFHRVTDAPKAFHEMVRVCRPCGRVVLTDVRAPEGGVRSVHDELEVMRDPSHVRFLSLEEMHTLFSWESLAVEAEEAMPMPTMLESWMELAKTPEKTRGHLRHLMERELCGGPKTGFGPYRTEQGICFDQDWVTIVGRKGAAA